MLDAPAHRRPARRLRRGHRPRLVAVVAVAAALVAPVGPAAADAHTTTDPAHAAAGWLAGQLVDGERLQTEFDGVAYDAPGPTADTVFALAAAGVAADRIEAAADWLEGQAESYAGFGDDVTTGAIGKLLLVAAVTGRDAYAFGGLDLVAEITAVEVVSADPDDAEALLGRFRDVSDYGDFSTPLTQALVLLGLHRTPGAAPSERAVEVLLEQQCPDGGFSERFLVGDDGCVGAVDTTAYAAQALDALGEDAAVAGAVAWLESQAGADGSFGAADGPNTNSTGLAAAALAIAGGDADVVAAARDFILGAQDGCDDASPGAIPFNTTERGFEPLSTAQALPGLVGTGLGTVDAAGASTRIPELDCGTPRDDAPANDDPPVDGAPEPDADQSADEGAADDGRVTGDDAEADTPRPTRVDAGDGVSATAGAPSGGLLVALATVLLVAGGAGARSRRRGPA